MRDIYLDPDTGDIGLTEGRMRLTNAEEGEAAAQRLTVRLRLFKGEYILDERQGMPYFDLLGRKGVQRRFEELLRRAVVTCPGIASLDAFSMTVDSDRNAIANIEAAMADGTPVVLDGFIVGDV